MLNPDEIKKYRAIAARENLPLTEADILFLEGFIRAVIREELANAESHGKQS